MSIVGKWFGFGSDDGYDAGVRAYELGRFSEAAESFDACLVRTKDATLRRLARFYLGQSYARLGVERLQVGDIAGAEAAFRQALDLQPAYPDLHCLYASALEAKGDRVGLERELRIALEINPLYADAALRLGQLEYADGRHESAMALISKAVRAGRGVDVDAYRGFAAAHQAGTHDQASALLGALTLVTAAPAVQQAQEAAAHVQAGRFEEATFAFEAALALEPGYADVRCGYGQALLELDRLDDAVNQFEAALAINPKYADAYAFLGVGLRRLQRVEESKQAFRRALACNPDHPIASLERSRLN